MKTAKVLIPLILFVQFHGVRAAIINQSVGRVGAQFLTARDVQLCHLVTTVLNRDVVKSGEHIKPIPIESPQLAESTSDCLVDKVLELEAGTINYATQGGKDLAIILALVREELHQSSSWTQWAFAEAELRAMIRQKLMVNDFLESKMRGFGAEVSDREIRAYFEAHPEEFAKREYEGVVETIRRKLVAEGKERKAGEWFALLHGKYKVRNFLSDLEWKKSLTR